MPVASLEGIASSERKREIVFGIARGKNLREIAEELGVAERTVKSHVDQMRMAFGGPPRREIPRCWFILTGENPYPSDVEMEIK